jgi:hypothetical protein
MDLLEGLVAAGFAEYEAKTYLVMSARQFVWMELFAQRIYNRLGPDLLTILDPNDVQIFESLVPRDQER